MESYAGLEAENNSLICPNCGNALEQHAYEGGKRLARCWHCGGMIRAASQTRPEWGRGETLARVKPSLELVKSYGPPHFQCPYCEHINRESNLQQSDSLFCANCGADLKTACLNCEKPMYVLDHFCPFCRTDQERAQYELEAFFWQQYNEGKRLARSGRWEDAYNYLALFFNPEAIGAEPHRAKLAAEIYRSSIALEDGGEGLRLFNDAIERLRRRVDEDMQQERRRRLAMWGVGLLVFCMLALWSALTFGAWWAIFVIGLGLVVIVGLLILFVLLSVGGM